MRLNFFNYLSVQGHWRSEKSMFSQGFSQLFIKKTFSKEETNCISMKNFSVSQSSEHCVKIYRIFAKYISLNFIEFSKFYMNSYR